MNGQTCPVLTKLMRGICVIKKVILTINLIIFQLLFASKVIGENIPKYDRDLFGKWADYDSDCQNTRHELLQERSQTDFIFSSNRCRVLTGLWYDRYSAQYFYDSGDVDIDHLVPLFYAWNRGAYSWSISKRREFANDKNNLFIVKRQVNRAKSASGPTDWLPPNFGFRCDYITIFQGVVERYGLNQKRSEAEAIAQLQNFYC